MNKSRPLDLSDTNIAGLGSDLDKKLRLDAASTEKAWAGAGKKTGLKVWRIEQFKVVAWPEDQYGQFHTGDSYIVMNTYKKKDGDALLHDIHFWLGLETTQDEAGTAAYKTVELDDFLAQAPVQHREVQGFETPLFLSYFKQFVTLSGGVASGFRHVEQDAAAKPRLLHIYALPNEVQLGPKQKRISTLLVKEVPLSAESLNSGDVFVLDQGKTILQWNGKDSTGMERNKAAEYVRKLDDSRKDAKVEVIEESDVAECEKFYSALGGKSGPLTTAEEGNKRKAANYLEGNVSKRQKKLYRLSDSSGQLTFNNVAQGTVQKNLLDGSDVFVFDSGFEVFVWVGKSSDVSEKKGAMKYALEYIKQESLPLHLPVAQISEGAENTSFLDAFDV